MQKTALLTAVASKLGPYIAKQLIGQNFQVIGHYYSGATKANALKSQGLVQGIFQADFNSLQQVDLLVKDIYQHYQEIDLLVNSASIFQPDTAADFTISDLQSNIYINALAGVRLAQQIAQRQTKVLKVVNILDVMSKKATKKYFSYNLSKRLLLQGGRLLKAGNANIKIKNLYLHTIDTEEDLKHFRFYF